MVIECVGGTNWINTLKSRYDITKTHLNESKEAFTVLFYPKPKQMLLIGRYDRVQGFGVVLCRRKVNILVEYEKRGQ